MPVLPRAPSWLMVEGLGRLPVPGQLVVVVGPVIAVGPPAAVQAIWLSVGGSGCSAGKSAASPSCGGVVVGSSSGRGVAAPAAPGRLACRRVGAFFVWLVSPFAFDVLVSLLEFGDAGDERIVARSLSAM